MNRQSLASFYAAKDQAHEAEWRRFGTARDTSGSAELWDDSKPVMRPRIEAQLITPAYIFRHWNAVSDPLDPDFPGFWVYTFVDEVTQNVNV